jgi:hypothetical protein
MSNGYEADEAIAEMLEGLESDEADEADFGEAPRRVSRVRPARPGTLFTPRPTGNYVTQVQLQAAMQKVEKQIQDNAKAITQVNGRLNTISTEQSKIVAAVKKESAERKKDTDALKRELQQTRELTAILPLLSAPKSQALTSDAGGLPAGTKVLVDGGDTLSTLLPLLLLGGLGGSSGGGGLLGGGSGGGGLDSSMLLVLLLALRK